MEPERQIDILETAQVRTDARVRAWIDDPHVKATIRASHEFVRNLAARQHQI